MYSLARFDENGLNGWNRPGLQRASRPAVASAVALDRLEPFRSQDWRLRLGLVGLACMFTALLAPKLIHPFGMLGDRPLPTEVSVARQPSVVSTRSVEDFDRCCLTSTPPAVKTEGTPPTAGAIGSSAVVDNPSPTIEPAPGPTVENAEQLERDVTLAAKDAPEPVPVSEPQPAVAIPTPPASAERDAGEPPPAVNYGRRRQRLTRPSEAARTVPQPHTQAVQPPRSGSGRSLRSRPVHAGSAPPPAEARNWSLPRALQPTSQ